MNPPRKFWDCELLDHTGGVLISGFTHAESLTEAVLRFDPRTTSVLSFSHDPNGWGRAWDTCSRYALSFRYVDENGRTVRKPSGGAA